MEINVFVEDLNSGYGEWFELPVDDIQMDIIDEVLSEPDNEYIVSDYDSSLACREMDSFTLEQFNNLARLVGEYESITDLYFSLDDNPLEVWEFNEETINMVFPDPWDAFVNGADANHICWTDDYMVFDGYGFITTMNEYQLEDFLADNIDEILENLEYQYVI